MLQSAEYEAIKADYDRISRAHFSRSYLPPDDMRIAKSDALFPAADLAEIISETVPANATCIDLTFELPQKSAGFRRSMPLPALASRAEL
jgi:hypothetical protein